MGAFSLIMGLFSFIASTIAIVKNDQSQRETNQKNEELLRESWERDDTATQRTREDVEKAGFSPLAAIGNNLGNTNPVQMTAPQMDVSGLNKSFEQMGAWAMQKKEMEMYNEQIRGTKLDNDLKESKFQMELLKFADELDAQRKSNDITEAEYIAKIMALKAEGLSDEYVKYMLDNRQSWQVPDNDQINKTNSIAAQIGLTNSQKDLTDSQKDLTDSQKDLTDAQAAALKASNNAGIEWKNGKPYDKKTEKELTKLDWDNQIAEIEKGIKEYEKTIKEAEADWKNKTITIEVPSGYYRSESGGITLTKKKLTGKPAEVLEKARLQLEEFDRWAKWNQVEQDPDVLKAIKPWIGLLNPLSSLSNFF